MSQPPPSTDTPPYTPTRIRRLYVRGYRSIRELDLVDLPPIVVLHGENGAGKSNILRAMALPLRWLASDGPLAGSREASERIDYATADEQLGIRRDDFNRLSPHEMQFRIELELGSKSRKIISGLPEQALLVIDVMVQDVGDGIRWWFDRAQVGEDFSLTGLIPENGTFARQELARVSAELNELRSRLGDLRSRLKLDRPEMDDFERDQLAKDSSLIEARMDVLQGNRSDLVKVIAGNALIWDRFRSKLLRRGILGISEAYRRIQREAMTNAGDFDVDDASVSADQVQQRLYLLATSSSIGRRSMLRTLSKYLEDVMGSRGESSGTIELAAVRNIEFREYETQISRGSLEGVPITSLGTGEQQLFILLLDVLVAATPIVQIEEPEAHLHKKLMLRLAKLLEKLVEKNDVDQLFLATHHHAFAIAPEYYDVTYNDEHGTQAKLTNRARAIDHFYEPGPLWEALRSLVASGLQGDAVIFRDESGEPKHAREILASIKEEGPLAKRFAEEMTKTILLSMREEAEFRDP